MFAPRVPGVVFSGLGKDACCISALRLQVYHLACNVMGIFFVAKFDGARPRFVFWSTTVCKRKCIALV